MTDNPISKTKDQWKSFRYFLGEWQGTGTGQSGVSRTERKYELILNNRFIQIHNRSVYKPWKRIPRARSMRTSDS